MYNIFTYFQLVLVVPALPRYAPFLVQLPQTVFVPRTCIFGSFQSSHTCPTTTTVDSTGLLPHATGSRSALGATFGSVFFSVCCCLLLVVVLRNSFILSLRVEGGCRPHTARATALLVARRARQHLLPRACVCTTSNSAACTAFFTMTASTRFAPGAISSRGVFFFSKPILSCAQPIK